MQSVIINIRVGSRSVIREVDKYYLDQTLLDIFSDITAREDQNLLIDKVGKKILHACKRWPR